MIDTVTFENERGEILRPYEDCGVFMVSHDAPQPKAKIYRVSLDGMDGDVDMTEWAGEVRYNTRTVTVNLRDLGSEGHKRITQFVNGRRMKVTFSDEPEWYYDGRCENMSESTRKRVTNQTLTFICQPYKLAHRPTIVSHSISETETSIPLVAVRKSAIPEITVTDSCQITFEGNVYSLSAGTHVVPTIIIKDVLQIMKVTGSGSITIKWQDGMM